MYIPPLQIAKEDIHHLLSKMAGFDSTLGGGVYVTANIYSQSAQVYYLQECCKKRSGNYYEKI
jgi:virulence-associated protein VapD